MKEHLVAFTFGVIFVILVASYMVLAFLMGKSECQNHSLSLISKAACYSDAILDIGQEDNSQ